MRTGVGGYARVALRDCTLRAGRRVASRGEDVAEVVRLDRGAERSFAECRGAFQPCDFGGRELFASEGQKKIILNIRKNGSTWMHALAFSLTIVL